MKKILIIMLFPLFSINSCMSMYASQYNNGRGSRSIPEWTLSLGLDGWAVQGMLRSPTPWIQAAGYGYGGLALWVLAVHLYQVEYRGK